MWILKKNVYNIIIHILYTKTLKTIVSLMNNLLVIKGEDSILFCWPQLRTESVKLIYLDIPN